MYRGLRKDPDIQFSADIAMLETLILMLDATPIQCFEHSIRLQKSRRANMPSTNNSRNISASRLLEQFKNESARQSSDKQTILASFGEHSRQKRPQIKKQFIQFEETKQQKTNQQQQYFKQSRLYTKKETKKINNNTSQSTFKQQHEIKQSAVTFSPLRIDISLPSLTSQDLDQLKEQKLFINQIQSDIKQLIKKIKSNQCSEDCPPKEEKIRQFTKYSKKSAKR